MISSHCFMLETSICSICPPYLTLLLVPLLVTGRFMLSAAGRRGSCQVVVIGCSSCSVVQCSAAYFSVVLILILIFIATFPLRGNYGYRLGTIFALAKH